MYGESLGTSSLAKSLRELADALYSRLDNGDAWDEIADDEARSLMEGAMVLWERLAREV